MDTGPLTAISPPALAPGAISRVAVGKNRDQDKGDDQTDNDKHGAVISKHATGRKHGNPRNLPNGFRPEANAPRQRTAPSNRAQIPHPETPISHWKTQI
jgi:hypothetical protein